MASFLTVNLMDSEIIRQILIMITKKFICMNQGRFHGKGSIWFHSGKHLFSGAYRSSLNLFLKIFFMFKNAITFNSFSVFSVQERLTQIKQNISVQKIRLYQLCHQPKFLRSIRSQNNFKIKRLFHTYHIIYHLDNIKYV